MDQQMMEIGALDYDNVCKVTGGTLISAGSSGMLQAPTTDSTQYSISVIFEQNETAGTKIAIKNSTGEEILSYTPSKNFKSIVISSKILEKDQTYTIYANDEKVSDITISNIVNSIGNSNSNMQNRGMLQNGGRTK
jgi:hypothetical protein